MAMNTEQRLHRILIWEFMQYEFDGLKMGCSIAKDKFEVMDSVISVVPWSVDELLDYHGYEFDKFENAKEIESLYNEVVASRG